MRRLLAGLAIGVAAVAVAAPAAAAAGAPYRDPNATGSIGLCDRAGHQITHGSVTSAPFAWRAVSSVAAPSGYGVAGGTATLLAYQPRKGVASGEWSGDELTSASRYSNPSHPIAASTRGDESLQGFLTAYKAQWDGLIELRLYLGAPNAPLYSQTYPALDIQVTGNMWHTVDGTAVSCQSGHAVSLESILLKTQHPSAGTSSSPATPKASSPTTAAAATPAAALTATDSGSGNRSAILVAVVVGLVLIAGGYASWLRFRTAPSKKGH